MTNRAWAIKFMTDVLYECNQDASGKYKTSRNQCQRTALRHFPREINRLVRRLESVLRKGRSLGWSGYGRFAR
jgi:hypothetical protein